jgi:hypothetical protein
MESFTRINIAELQNGKYFYHFHIDIKPAIAAKIQRVYKEMKAAYPAPKYKIDVTYWECIGKSQNMGE